MCVKGTSPNDVKESSYIELKNNTKYLPISLKTSSRVRQSWVCAEKHNINVFHCLDKDYVYYEQIGGYSSATITVRRLLPCACGTTFRWQKLSSPSVTTIPCLIGALIALTSA